MFRCLLLLALGGLLSSPTLVAQSTETTPVNTVTDPVEIVLAAMSEAGRQISYTGVLSWTNGATEQNVRVVHQVEDGIEYERIFHLDGAAREVIREAMPVSCLQPGQALRRARFAQLDSMVGGVYEPSIVGEERVAGRLAWKMQLAPIDQYRFAHLVFVDQASGLILKSLLLDRQGQVLESMQYLDIQIRPITPEELSAQTNSPLIFNQPSDCVQGQLANYDDVDWAVTEPPPGFELFSAEYDAENDRTWLMYGDGYAVFSVFIEPGVNGRGIQRVGAISLVAQPIKVEGEDYTITLLGDVPSETVERSIASLRRRGNTD